MDMEAFQDKMDQNHRAYFCRMLKMKELPDCLLERYARVKLLADRIDAFLSPGELALVEESVGFNPDTGKFCVTEQLRAQPADEQGKEPADEAPKTDESKVDKPVEQAAETHMEPALADESGKELAEPPVEQAAEQAAKEAVEKTAAPVEASAMTGAEAEAERAASGKIWSLGMPVSVLQADDLKEGKIVSILSPEPGSDKAVELTVQFEGGETVTVDEDEVEAV